MEKIIMHDAWHVLFFNPFFWEQTGKRGLNLRGVCKSFRSDIPEHLAIEAAFRAALIRKVDVYRLFPLSVNDVVRLRSPLFFVDAFRLAVRKSGGFDFCIAVVRDKGWTLWNSRGVERDRQRSKLVADLVAWGVTRPVTGPLFESAVSRVDSAVVWYHDAFTRELHPWESFRPSPDAPRRLKHSSWEYDTILFCIYRAVGFWYKGINRDVRSVCDGIRMARKNHAEGRPVYCMHHQHIAGGKFVLGVVNFRPLDGLGCN